MENQRQDNLELIIPNIFVRLGMGYDAIVYRISNDKVAKFYRSFDEAEHEYKMCQGLYERGVSVPKPHGLFNIIVPEEIFNKNIWPAFVRQFIDGIDPRDAGFDGKGWRNFWNLQEEQVKKAMEVGILSHDLGSFSNMLWVSSEQRIYFIDFSRCRKTHEEPLCGDKKRISL